MTWKLLNVFNYDGFLVFPCCAAHALAEADAGAGYGTLEGTEHQLLADDAVEARPPEVEGLLDQCGHIGHIGDGVALVFYHRLDLGEEEFIVFLFVHVLLVRPPHQRSVG